MLQNYLLCEYGHLIKLNFISLENWTVIEFMYSLCATAITCVLQLSS
jgi:hypothetical protein